MMKSLLRLKATGVTAAFILSMTKRSFYPLPSLAPVGLSIGFPEIQETFT